jgi:Ca2+-transporting ATPase
MITGDGPITARSIADQAGRPPGPVLWGSDLAALGPAGLADQVASVSVFARVMP